MRARPTSRTFILCFLSAMLGAGAAIVWIESRPLAQLNAQELVPGGPRPQTLPPVIPRPGFGPQVPGVPQNQMHALSELTQDEQAAVRVYETCNLSVVNISTRGVRADLFFLEAPTEGTGSGSVIDTQGHILTNYHVVEEAREIQVTLFNGQTFEGRMIGQDPINDVAVLKIDAPQEMLYPVTLGDSSRLRVGQNVYAIGNPFGLERTLTTGVVSSLNRSLPGRRNRMLKSIIQIDAAINPGNSGGPLLDSRGRLIGMNTAIASRTGQSSDVGFAIPVNSIARVAPQLIKNGRLIRADAGIAAVYETGHGLRIAQLMPQGPAEKAGLQGPQIVRRRRGPLVYETADRTAADTIVAVNGEPAKTADEFLTAIESHQPGETVTITVIRDNQQKDLPLTLGQALDK